MSTLPPLVPLGGELHERHHHAHERLDRLRTEVEPAIETTARRLSRRLLIEALANVQPVFFTAEAPLLLPPPRRFLDRRSCQRMAGAEVAFRHIDCALEMSAMPGGRAVVQPHLPIVLNALLAGPVMERETNPGLLRMTQTSWNPDANAFLHPSPGEIPGLVDAAMSVAADSSHPALERAGWLSFVTMTVHPFVDGNGRTARALFLAVASAEVPGGIDWGVLDQWHLARTPYVRALQAGQQAAQYSADAVDAEPFSRFAAQSSIRGAELGLARLELLARAGASVPDLLDPIVGQVVVDRFVSIDDLLADVAEPSSVLAHLDELVERGVLAFTHAGPAVDPELVGARGVVVGEALEHVARELRQARLHGG